MSSDAIAVMEKEVAALQKAVRILADPDFVYHLRKYIAGYNALISTYAPFKVGDRVRLTRAPVITEQNAPGWMDSKHFLVKGATGTVSSSDIDSEGTLWYGIVFDAESWLDSGGKAMPVEDRHVYSFRGETLEGAPPDAFGRQ